jgi:hypothetical protein
MLYTKLVFNSSYDFHTSYNFLEYHDKFMLIFSLKSKNVFKYFKTPLVFLNFHDVMVCHVFMYVPIRSLR